MQNNETNDLARTEKRILEQMARLEGRLEVLRDDLQETKDGLGHMRDWLAAMTITSMIIAIAFCVRVILTLYNGY